jgi:type II secretory pathway pseudopilin PulG
MGKLNLLKHKSWNVYSKRNQERVAQDEAAHAQELQQQEQAQLRQQQAARREQLRARQGLPSAGPSATPVEAEEPEQVPTGAPRSHIHLFAPAEQEAVKKRGQQISHATRSQKSIEHEQWALQFTSRLGETRDGKKAPPAWYAHDRPLVRGSDEPLSQPNRRGRKRDLEATHQALDPMRDHVSRAAASSVHDATSPSAAPKGMDQLRQERMARESRERARATALLGTTAPTEADRRRAQDPGYYHAQFHPDLVAERQRRGPSSHSRRNPY